MTFDPTQTTDIQALVLQWSSLPIGELFKFFGGPGCYRYAYVGTHDRTMYPLIVPGAIVQVDERRREITPPGSWSSEIERPIYFLETRTGFACCWCTRDQEGNIILQPHPLSRVAIRVLRLEEVEIMGLVVGIAMRLKTSFRLG